MIVDYDLNEAMARLVEMQREALFVLAPPVNCDAVPYWPYQQEATPYWWNRFNSMTVEPLSGDMVVDRWVIEMGLVVAHLTEGYRGENYVSVGNWIVAVLAYFDDHRDLTTSDVWTGTQYLTELDHLYPDEEGAFITGIPGGTRAIANAGTGATQIYLGFNLDLPLLRRVY